MPSNTCPLVPMQIAYGGWVGNLKKKIYSSSLALGLNSPECLGIFVIY